MNYNEFSEKIKAKYPQYKDMDNKELAQKMVAKYPQYGDIAFDDVEQPKENKGIDLTPSGIGRTMATATVAPFYAAKKGQKVSDAYNEIQGKLAQTPKTGFEKTLDVAATFALPQTKILQAGRLAPLVNNLVTGAYQGGLIGGIQGLQEGKGLEGAAGGAGIGATLTAGIPIVGKVAQKGFELLPQTGSLFAKTLGRIQPETLKRAVQPDSVALDLTRDEAQNLLMNTTEGLRNNYNQILADKGNVVGRLLQDLPESTKFKADDIIQDYDKIFDNYSLSKNENLNPAIRATKKEMQDIEGMLYGDDFDRVGQFKQDLDELKFPNGKLETQANKYKNRYYSKTLNSLNNDIVIANRRFNDEILGNLKQHPEWLNDPKKIEMLENHIAKYSVPEEYMYELYNKFYDAVGKGSVLNKGNNLVSPKELYDINKNVSNMVRWDVPDSITKNDVLEQIYGQNAERISNLSPQLKEANKVYSDLMDFQKNEGIRNILNNSNKIDTASSALRNYNSTVTKGNTNRNIQDLEKLMVNEGYAPFLNNIDDVNAAMDLLNARTTGDSWLANLATQMTRPALKATRGLNRAVQRYQIPQKLENLKNLVGGWERYTTPGLYGAPVMMLEGGLQYNDYR